MTETQKKCATTSHFVPLFSLACWAILTFLVWWTRFRSSIIRISERRVSRGGQELIRGEGPVLWLYSSFLAPSLGSNRSPDFFYRQLLKAGRLFGAFRRGVEHRDSPLVSPSGGIVRMSSWLLWVPFNYSSSNWAVFLWLNGRGGFLFLYGRKWATSPAFFADLGTLKPGGRLVFSLSQLGCRVRFFSHPPFLHWSEQAPDSSPASRFHIGDFLCWKSWETQVSEANLRVYLPGVRADFGGKI